MNRKTIKQIGLVAVASLLGNFSVTAAESESQQKIISVGYAITELVYALDAQDQLVGVDVTSITEGDEIPKVGYHRALSAEGLLALQPDRLIGSEVMGPKSTLDQLQRAGIDIQITNEEPTVAGLKERIEQIAKLVSREDKVAELHHQVNDKVTALEANQPKATEAKKVLFLLIHEGRPANVAGLNTIPDGIIKLAGGINTADSVESYKPLSNEAMIAMQPDVILVSGRSYQTLGGVDGVLKALPSLAATPAGQNKQILTVDGHAIVGGLGLRSLSEAARINELLYP
ncbi:heme/hemin ABC transporter substrate-binding protein [Vibrio hippocampi]|uniref:Hemin-binding periplasmic protein HmuT n=1 Tax=Vibrio hippocampi TaxID=654686 RepID=A0ABM8ZNM8_9VIBR|nr:ABC transporter substrate-binding protein [Vibrio hippocampi]CAH0530207.1 Hemin-binding periplasmic protein HmuT [Vibrio hippocampi]